MTTETKYLTTAERSKMIRKELKARFGYTAKDVSVRTHNYAGGSSINVTVKNIEADFEAIEEIANGQQSVRRCEYSGDILSGGNRFVFTSYSSEANEEMSKNHLAVVEAAIEVAKSSGSLTSMYPIEGTQSFVGIDGLGRFNVTHKGSMVSWCYDAKSVSKSVFLAEKTRKAAA